MKYIKIFENYNRISENNIEEFEHGKCEVFMLALNHVLGYDMYLLLDKEAYFEDSDQNNTALVHAYTKDNDGNMYDASGKIDKKQLEEDHAEYINAPLHIKITEKELYNKYIKTGFLDNISKEDLFYCKNYILNNINKYK